MSSVILPMIRRVMPGIIANEILGVQPMSGPTAGIFNLSNGWRGRVVFTKEHFNHFLRVYNRRKHHHPDYLTNLGYTKIRLGFYLTLDANKWCRETFRHGTYVRSSVDFWFAYDEDATFFRLRWA